MPSIMICIAGEPAQDLTSRVAKELMQLTSRMLRKERKKTVVMVRYLPKSLWFIAGQSLAEDSRNSFRLEVTITDETNTKAEKAAYHKAAFEMLEGIIGDLHPRSSIHVIDCRATAYGYGGVTQEYRYHHAEEPAVIETR